MHNVKYFIILSLLALIGCSTNTNKTHKKDVDNPLLGSWSYTYPDNGCIETYQFLSDGIRLSKSNLERVKAKYDLQSLSKEKNLYLLTDTVLEDNAEQDCAGSTSDMTNDKVELYLTIKENPKSFTFCIDKDSKTCVGPFIKK